MTKVENVTWYAVVPALTAAGGFALSFLTFLAAGKRAEREEERRISRLSADVGYIRSGVDELKQQSRETAAELGAVAERLTRVEESSKQAHRRVDRLDGRFYGKQEPIS